MKIGDLVKPRPEYTVVFPIPVGIIIEEINRIPQLETTLFNVLLPQGIFRMYSFEMEAVPDPCKPAATVV
jgi:hypothetical protein